MRKMNKNLFLVKCSEQKSEVSEDQNEDINNSGKIKNCKNKQTDTQAKQNND